MRSGQPARCGSQTAWLIGSLAATWLCALTAYAEPRAVCVDLQAAEWVARIRGQTRDLPLQLSFATLDLSVPVSEDDLARAARTQNADYIVHVQARPDGAHVVSVYDARAQAVRTRTAPAPSRSERFSRSAQAETLALIVRGELSEALRERALAEQAAPGDTSSAAPDSTSSANTTAATSAPNPTPPQPTVSTENTEPTDTELPESVAPPQQRTHRQLSFSLSLGAQLSWPGESYVFFAPTLAAHLRVSHLSVGIALDSSLKSRAEPGNSGLYVDLRKHAAHLEALTRIVLGAHVALDLGARASLFVYQRAARAAAGSEWETTGDQTLFSPSVGPVLDLRVRVIGSFGLAVRGGLAIILRAPRFSVASDQTRTPVSHLSALEPWSALSLFVDL